jgi:DNA-binding CsgD family transcriptional regulator
MENGVGVPGGLVVVNQGGFIAFASDATRALMARYLGPLTENQLPAPLAQWVDLSVGRAEDIPFVAAREGGQLVVRRFFAAGMNEILLVVKEQAIAVEATRRRQGGLTPREREVLWWVAEGKTNREIGMILGRSARTVQIHLNRVYRKLGVETRTAAAMAVFRASSVREAAA